MARYPLSYTQLSSTLGTVCNDQVTHSESFIGKDKNVKVQVASCPQASLVQREITLENRQTNVCATNCAPAFSFPVTSNLRLS